MSRLTVFVLSVSPMFYAMVAGGLLGAAVNLLTGMLFSASFANAASLIVASLLLCVAAVMLSYVGVRLEDIRSTAASNDRRNAMLRENAQPSYFVLISFLFCGAVALILVIGGLAGIHRGCP